MAAPFSGNYYFINSFLIEYLAQWEGKMQILQIIAEYLFEYLHGLLTGLFRIKMCDLIADSVRGLIFYLTDKDAAMF